MEIINSNILYFCYYINIFMNFGIFPIANILYIVLKYFSIFTQTFLKLDEKYKHRENMFFKVHLYSDEHFLQWPEKEAMSHGKILWNEVITTQPASADHMELKCHWMTLPSEHQPKGKLYLLGSWNDRRCTQEL